MQGQGESCYFLGGNYRYGYGVGIDRDLWARHTLQGCALKHERPCVVFLERALGSPEKLWKKIEASIEALLDYPGGHVNREREEEHEAWRDKNRDDLLPAEEHVNREKGEDREAWRDENRTYLLTAFLSSTHAAVDRCEKYAEEEDKCPTIKLRSKALLATAYAALRSRCEDQSDAPSCYVAGRVNALGAAQLEDNEEWLDLQERGCQLGHISSCNSLLNHFYYNGRGTAPELKRAHELSLKVCPVQTEQAPIPEDAIRIGRLWPSSWLPRGCKEALMTTVLTQADLKEARSVAQTACETSLAKRDPFNCGRLVHNVLHDIALTNPERLSDYLKAHCEESGEARSCNLYARALWESDPEQAAIIATAQCERDEGEADCSELGRQLLSQEGSEARGVELLEFECSVDFPSCFYLGRHLLASQDEAQREAGRDVLRRGCSRNDGRACTRLGRLYLGEGSVKKDEERAETLFSKACELSDYEACLLPEAD